MSDKKTNETLEKCYFVDMHKSHILSTIKQLDIMIGTEKALIKHATMGECEYSEKIKALEMAKKALETKIPKKVVREQNDVFNGYDYYCPNCKNDLDCFICFIIDADIESDAKYCGHCGQALDWSDT